MAKVGEAPVQIFIEGERIRGWMDSLEDGWSAQVESQR
jgi:hypothetical protein